MTNVLEYLEETAGKYPEKEAFADENNSCTFKELQERARRIGSALAGRTEPGKPVAVWMEKSVNAVAAFLGIVYAGCFYVMLDKVTAVFTVFWKLHPVSAYVLQRFHLCF